MFTHRVGLPPSAQNRMGRLEERRRSGKPIWVAAAHDASSAKALEEAGADLLVFHPGYLPARNSILESLRPLGNGNEGMMNALPEVASSVSTALIAGICGSDPFLLRGPFFESLKKCGVAGVMNFPTLGLLDGVFRANLEESGIGFEQEVETLAAARAAGLAALAITFDPEQAAACASIGSEFLALYPRPETGAGALRRMVVAAREKNPEALLLGHADSMENASLAADAWRDLDDLAGFISSGPAERFTAYRAAVEKSRN